MNRMVLGSCLALVLSCSRVEPTGGAPGHARPAPSSASRTLHVAASVVADAKLRMEVAHKGSLEPTVDLMGETVADPDKSARVSSPVAGRIEQVSFQEGAVVQKGASLATIRVPELGRIRSAQAATLTKATAARSNAERLQALRDKGLAGEQEVVNARAEADALNVEAKALAEQLGAMGTGTAGQGALLSLRAPIAGTVVHRNAVIGQPVTADEVVATIADLGRVWFLGRAFERDLKDVDVGATASVTLNALADTPLAGTVAFIAKEPESSSRAFPVRIPLDNAAGRLRLGLFGTARIARIKPTGAEMIVLHRSAVVDLDGRRVVFVQKGPEEFEGREVELGPSSGDRTAVTKGLSEGETVVVEGAFTLKSLSLKAAFAEEE